MPLSEDLVQTLRLLKSTAATYLLLLLSAGEPLSSAEVARVLACHSKTALRQLRSLEMCGFAAREGGGSRYRLTPKGADLLLSGVGGTKLRLFIIKNQAFNSDSQTISNKQEALDAAFLRSPENEVWQALRAVGIMPNERTRRMAALPHVTPQAIWGHYRRLERRGQASQTGLLVSLLESGAAAPPVNENNHLKDCRCEKCQRLEYGRCWTCGENPCVCDQSN